MVLQDLGGYNEESATRRHEAKPHAKKGNRLIAEITPQRSR